MDFAPPGDEGYNPSTLGRRRRMRGGIYGRALEPDSTSRKKRELGFFFGIICNGFSSRSYAILTVANWEIDERLKDRRIAICSDSQAALRALSSPLITWKIIQECRNRFNSIFRFNMVKLLWVPDHCGVEENEILDALAKVGSVSPVKRPEPAIRVSVAFIKAVFKNWK